MDDGIQLGRRISSRGRHFDHSLPPTIAIYLVLSFRSSVYTGRMLPQPTLRVMKKGRDVYEVEVAAARPTRHSVTAGAGDVERLTGGKANAERLIEESFRFLLERESNTSSSAPSRSPTSATIFPNTNARFAAVSAVLHEEARKPATSMRWSTSTLPPSATRTSCWCKPKR